MCPDRGDPELILSVLPEAEQAMVERWERVLGLPRGGWFTVPRFRLLVTLGATLEAAPGGAAAFLETAEGLGFRDGGQCRNTHPTNPLARTHPGWIRACV